ncbi:ferrochelatase [Telmatospirillum sp. J64-1]|uniref:ferrochelatase n=1 Tax=Telmatospirillum sp. J64-1 TaxID=2502183 RepID=UPI00115CEB66|nr:ferrochelatase [Telmatospirillum sp. J64-1]
MSRTAIVFFNLGGPDSPEAVKPFLFNLFNDPCIIGVPTPVRYLLAKLISARRAPVAREIYGRIGGKSPLLELTQEQAKALEEAMDGETKVFIAMRYWHPMTEETVAAVKAWKPDQVVLLPLYPQYSTTTSKSSIGLWRQKAAAAGLEVPTRTICCYPTAPGMIEAFAALIAPKLDEAAAHGRPRLLFSAHGLPKKVIAAGDPYQWQVEQSSAAVVSALNRPDLDWAVCYQSRVGPLEWIGPSTEAELKRAGQDKVPVVVVPIAFVSEHSETLVELDIEYGELAHEVGIPAYLRVPALGSHPAFIRALADLVGKADGSSCDPCSQAGGRLCPSQFGGCPNAQPASGESR